MIENRILYLITDSGTGGSEKVLSQILKGLDRKKINPVGVLVLKTKKEMALEWEKWGVPVYEIGMKRFPTPAQILKVRQFIKKFRPQIVHAFLFHSVQVARLIHFFNPAFKLITSPRVNYRFAPASALLIDRLMSGTDDLTICESNSTQTYLQDQLGYAKNKTMVIQNGVDSETYKFDSLARGRLRKEWGVQEHEMLVGAVGRLHDQKGFDVLIDSLSNLKKSPVAFKTVIVGEGPEEAVLKEAARNNNVSVIFPGRLTQMKEVYSAFDIFVQSSRYEGMSNALLEALSIGCSVVATAVDGTLDIANDGQNMVLVRPNDSLALSVAIGTLLEKEHFRKTLSENGKITAEKFSTNKMIQEFEQTYSQL